MSLKYVSFTALDCKDKGIRKLEFVTKTKEIDLSSITNYYFPDPYVILN